MKELLRKLFVLLVCVAPYFSIAQNTVNIAVLTDNDGHAMDIRIKEETEAILADEYTLNFNTFQEKELLKPGKLSEIYSQSDIVISSGLGASFIVSRQSSFSKPTILPFVFNAEFQKLPQTTEGTSGKKNLTYVESPFKIDRDLQTMYDIKPYEYMAFMVHEGLYADRVNIHTFMHTLVPEGVNFKFVNMDQPKAQLLEELSEFDAYYMLPHDKASADLLKEVYGKIADEGKVAFSLFSQPGISQGAYAAYETDANMQRVPRRVALNVMKILEGQSASDLSVRMGTFTEDLIINMTTVNRSGVYPPFDVMNAAIIENLSEQVSYGEELTLEAAIAEALQNNLQLAAARKQIDIGSKDVSIAQSNLLPQLDASASVYGLDKTRTIFQGQGTLGAVNLNAALDLTQVVFSEPALANIAIQKLLNESNKYALEQNELDVVQNVVSAYIGILQTKSLVDLTNDNLKVTRKNYNIAKSKNAIGQSGASDVYRWESQQALQNVEVNNAMAQLGQARNALNLLLNRPIDDVQPIADVTYENLDVFVNDEKFFSLIDRPSQIEKMSNFFVEEAITNLPELKQIEASINAQKRNVLSQKRAFYLPSLAVSGNLTQPLGHYNIPKEVMRVDDVPRQYQLALGAQLPLFQGNARRHRLAQSKVQILQLEDNKGLMQRNLELNVHNNLIQSSTSYQNREMAQLAAESAKKNFEIAQNAYEEGVLNVTSLIDAQNALLQANVNAINAEYQFMQDFIGLGRSYGSYYFLLSPSEKSTFVNRMIDYLTKQ